MSTLTTALRIRHTGTANPATLTVKQAPLEPQFGRFSFFNAERRAHTKRRKGLISSIKHTINSSEPDNASAQIAERIQRLDTCTLEVLVRESMVPDQLEWFIHDTMHLPQRIVRELAAFHKRFEDINYKTARLILEILKYEAHPLFAYEDFSQMTKDELELFDSILGFYLSLYETMVDSQTRESINSDSARTGIRYRALNQLPLFTPNAIVLICENKKRHDDLIRFIAERNLRELDADVLREYLHSPAQAISSGIL